MLALMILDWLSQLKHMKKEQVHDMITSLSIYGPIPGIALPFSESFLPFLPLILIIAANVNVYGLGLGFLYSWIGITLGSLLLFYLARKLGGRFGHYLQRRFPLVAKFFAWIEDKGFTPVFLLACLPFAPSFFITIAAGLSTLKLRTFAIAMMLGKAVMILCIAILSFDITELADEPWRVVAAAVFIALLWLVGKKLESRVRTP